VLDDLLGAHDSAGPFKQELEELELFMSEAGEGLPIAEDDLRVGVELEPLRGQCDGPPLLRPGGRVRLGAIRKLSHERFLPERVRIVDDALIV
jgi:hypothetical protein